MAALPDEDGRGRYAWVATRGWHLHTEVDGVVVTSYSGLPTRYTVIVDPRTGHLLGFEQMLTTDAGKLDVPIPSVIGYEAFLSARSTDHLDGPGG